ncbi:MAG: gamma-glutamylcyclotransferase [Alishewanella sp.]|nr:gamma-glutamylcyclotransferase [Alishewanella sp.]MDP5036828.1 gamma-glutamylcyclotransferase [Alishewanella sp.]MDP5187569.1 gamma-glutamylcyclotransferase [Alishewanella sp.]
MSEYLFVYGTLRQHAPRRAAGNRCYQLLQQYARLVGLGGLQAKLYLVDYYPGAVPSNDPAWQVVGEVYQLAKAANLLTELDAYEECGPGFASPTEYLRLKQPVTLQNGAAVTAWVYVYNRATDDLKPILSGDFTLDGN